MLDGNWNKKRRVERELLLYIRTPYEAWYRKIFVWRRSLEGEMLWRMQKDLRKMLWVIFLEEFGSPALDRKRIMIIRYYFWLFDSDKGQSNAREFHCPSAEKIIKEGSSKHEKARWKEKYRKLNYCDGGLRRKTHNSNQISPYWQIAGDLWAGIWVIRWVFARSNLKNFSTTKATIALGFTSFPWNFSLVNNNFSDFLLASKYPHEMYKNEIISERGELSKDILLNVAEILTLRLPAGTGEKRAEKNVQFYDWENFMQNESSPRNGWRSFSHATLKHTRTLCPYLSALWQSKYWLRPLTNRRVNPGTNGKISNASTQV